MNLNISKTVSTFKQDLSVKIWEWNAKVVKKSSMKVVQLYKYFWSNWPQPW